MRSAAFMLVASLLFVAVSAGAKPWHEDEEPVAVVTISGAGLAGPILPNGDRVWRLLYLGTYHGAGLPASDPPSGRSLGTAYEARYRFVPASGRMQVLRQTLYPCAADGRVWVETPRGQDRVHHRRMGPAVLAGWWHSSVLARTIEDAGLRCEDVRSMAIAQADEASGAHGWLNASIATLAVLLTLSGIALHVHRKRNPLRAS